MTRYLVPFSVLEQTIQAGQCVDSPEVLYHYLKLTEEYAERLSIPDAALLHKRVFNVLLDTVCDTSLAPHWRQTCLDKVYLPLSQLKRLIVTYQDARNYFKMEHSLRTLSHYFISSFEQ
ncbi:hypothetical protein MUS1_03910 [Marinomonas ushuaiensis DSM 15871]|uniref:Uncharacterized protein n=1 Tax=Marinomonas ushuaiensis DSM 15871 TaxID=1122207 RepID=X7E2A2_9GAMM|nr:hypothetical protein [Marinomonas ushuaiensis]ETX10204.1 hypothetical protein MUS1_03910 [Marinomonas ushuaiensis DSM 15871]